MMTVMEKEDLVERLRQEWPDGVTLQVNGLTGFDVSAWVGRGCFKGVDYLPARTTDWIRFEKDMTLTAEARLKPEQYDSIRPSDRYYDMLLHEKVGRDACTAEEICITTMMQRQVLTGYVELFVDTAQAPEWLYLEGIQLKEAVTVALHHPQLSSYDVKTVLQLMDINSRGADAMKEGRLWTPEVCDGVRTEISGLDFDENLLVRMQAELRLRQMGIIPTREALLVVDLKEDVSLQRMRQITDDFNRDFQRGQATEFGHAVFVPEKRQVWVSLYYDRPIAQTLVRQNFLALPEVNGIREEAFRDVTRMDAFQIVMRGGDKKGMYKGFLNPPLDAERLDGYVSYPLEPDTEGEAVYRITGQPAEGPVTDGRKRLWIEKPVADKLMQAGDGTVMVESMTALKDLGAMWVAEERQKKPLMYHKSRDGVYFYQKETAGYMYIDRRRNLTEVGEPMTDDKRQTVLALQEIGNVVQLRGKEMTVFFDPPENGERKMFLDPVTAEIRLLTEQTTVEGNRIYTDGRTVIDTASQNDITARVTDASVYGTEGRYFVRCRIDGRQRTGIPLQETDSRMMEELKNDADGLKLLAARYFCAELQQLVLERTVPAVKR